ncbi:MAG: two-component system, OmpR family, response regulator RegX3 [Thermomicrobiales bacterium]|nr:two-component system, OmpR family, response regulator RegX3 [Thermomicrobiales bacterium]
MARILVVEDDRSIAELVQLYLRRDGHEIEIVENGATALRHLESSPAPIDLVVLDLMLPGLDGRGVCRRLRATSDVPVIMLTALDDDRDKIEGLDLGADDYLTKPFNPQELVARVRAILRRAARPVTQTLEPDSHLEIGNLHLDLDAHRLLVSGQELALRTKEFDLLTAFAASAGIVLSRDQLLERVWGGEFDGDTRTVDVHVSRLRDRLDAAGATVEIETIRSVGYRLTAGR